MKRFFLVMIAVAFGAVTGSCGQESSADDNQPRMPKNAKSTAPKCSLQNPLACESSTTLMASPDFVAELDRFVGKADERGFEHFPSDLQFLPAHNPNARPRALDGDLLFVDTGLKDSIGDNGAAILQNGRIVAVALQYYLPPYHDKKSDLDIFVERSTPESKRWVEVLRQWGVKGEKVRVHELALLPKVR